MGFSHIPSSLGHSLDANINCLRILDMFSVICTYITYPLLEFSSLYRLLDCFVDQQFFQLQWHSWYRTMYTCTQALDTFISNKQYRYCKYLKLSGLADYCPVMQNKTFNDGRESTKGCKVNDVHGELCSKASPCLLRLLRQRFSDSMTWLIMLVAARIYFYLHSTSDSSWLESVINQG